jgi:5-methylcytosine-specific restriction enzyme A
LQIEKCPLCNRDVRENDMTLHHYIPKSSGGTLNDTMRICLTCHSFLHECIPLDKVCNYDSTEKLESHYLYKKYLEWARNLSHSNMITIKKIKRVLNF